MNEYEYILTRLYMYDHHYIDELKLKIVYFILSLWNPTKTLTRPYVSSDCCHNY